MAICFVGEAQAQTFTIQGKLQDSETRTSLQGATVLISSISDTTIFYTTYTDTSGRFQFDEMGRDSFRLIMTSIGYETITRTFKVDSTNVDLGEISVPKTSKELSEVTVTAGTPPAQQRGDTVQFNASQFKVNPDATAEDLARKIPGLTIEGGQVKAQGENVRCVTMCFYNLQIIISLMPLMLL